jgi:hypothetical protein
MRGHHTWFIARFGLLSALLLSQLVAAQPARSRFMMLGEDIVFYIGRIEQKTVDALIQSIGDRPIQRLVIDSAGGTLSDGIRLGQWVKQKGADVEVKNLCMSSCANYVFTAANKKTISDGALIVWHGSAEQKNFREEQEKYRLLLDRQSKGETLSAEETAYLLSNKTRYENGEEQRRLQREFFASIGVDEYLTRLGQEPTPTGSAWTVDLKTMKAFGVSNVTAPENYGTQAYVDKAFPQSGLRHIPLALTSNRP